MIQSLKARDNIIIKRFFFNCVITMTIAELTNSISAVVDGIITGQFLGSVSLAASGICTPYFSIACILSGILMVGCATKCTSAVAKGDKETLNRIFSMTFLIAIVLSILLSITLSVFAGPITNAFGAARGSLELKNESIGYLRGLAVGTPGFVLIFILTPLVQLDGNAKTSKIASIAVATSDIIGDILNVFVFKAGMFGMGLATGLSSIIGALILMTHFLKKDRMLRFSFKTIRFKEAPSMLKEGLSRVMSMIGRGLLPIVLNNMIGLMTYLNGAGSTAYSSLISSSFIFGALGWGIGGAVMIIGGIVYGEQDFRGVKTVVKSAFKMILIGVGALSVIVFALAPLIAKVFVPEIGLAQTLTTNAFRYYAIAMPFMAFNVFAANYFQATFRRLESNITNFVIEFALTALFALILNNSMGINAIWIAFPLGQFALCLIIICRCIIFRDKSRKGFDSLLILPKDFGVSKEDTIECSLSTIDEVVELSNEIGEFCEKHDITHKEANRLALCVEEMAGNVIEYGFADGKEHHLDVRIIYKNNDIVLRMRDDCEKFDLSEKVKCWNYDKEHPESNIGIRLVMGIAAKIDYTNVMNTNNLIITIKRDIEKK